MNKSTAFLVILAAILLPAALAFAGVRASVADRGGCPNDNSENGASHANDNNDDSAHGDDKQADRDCVSDTLSTPTPTPVAEPAPISTPEPTLVATAEPTPEPTPEPTLEPTPAATAEPTPTATASPEPTPTPAPTDAPTPTPPADVQLVDATVNSPAGASVGVQFVLTAGATIFNNGPVTPVVVDTTFTPVLPASCSATTGVKTVQDTTLPIGTNVFVSRSWMVRCSGAGTHTFTVDVNVAIDAAQPYVDPNPANNVGSASSVTELS